MKIESAFAVIAAMLMISVQFSGCIDKPAVWGNPGDSRTDFLGAAYKKIVVEVDYDFNAKPRSSALDLLKTRLESVCSKPIEIIWSDCISDYKTSYSLQDIKNIEDAHRDYRNQYFSAGRDVFYAYVLYLDGQYSDGSSVIGLAYSADSYAIFQENIKENVNPAGLHPTAEDVEKSVVVHEFGHLMGLVSRGQDTGYQYKEDPQHPHHSENKNSVMYWAVDTTDVIGAFLNGGTPNDFDGSDRKEMDTYR